MNGRPSREMKGLGGREEKRDGAGGGGGRSGYWRISRRVRETRPAGAFLPICGSALQHAREGRGGGH